MAHDERGMRDSTVRLFADLVNRDDAQISLPAAALAIARIGHPRLQIGQYLDRLTSMGALAAGRLTGVAVGEEVDALNEVVFGELGFRGDRDSYYDPRNSFLNEVIDRRRGIPITVSLVYMEIAAACGITIFGIGFPGHFIVRHVPDGRIVDPFNGGIELDHDACRRLLALQGIHDVGDVEPYVHSVSRRRMLERMLNNLGRYYRETSDAGCLNQVTALLAALHDSESDGPPRLVH